MSIKSRTLGIIAAAALGVAGVVVPASPSFAALPTCNTASPTPYASAVPLWAISGPTWEDSWDCQLRQGNTGDGVRWLQENLNRCYTAGLTVDSQFGPRTRSALVSAQRRAGTAADGIYGPNTRRAMVWFAYFHPGCQHAGV
ncbi:putative peptidoglycan binding protein [Asanoa ferruginea]|uniref:Putative peptidoglycan binding protein n=1 Tax=Asanoa ferruginea TaxID=53367 RepID=A0A3D9ZX24_9ACTN|nr:peptidoglycan-binding domain-containing protein [Asanoa ferruginea]REG01113.1 putative peptidoglycan binding protein [Asanoa ferruginea]